MFKKVMYLILSIVGIIYIFSLSATILYPAIETAGWFGKMLFYLARYGGVAIIFTYCSVNFLGSPWKIALNVILMLVTILYVFITIFPDQISQLLGFI